MTTPLLTQQIGFTTIVLVPLKNGFRVSASGIFSKRVCGKIITNISDAVNEFYYKTELLNQDINGHDDE